MVGTVPRACAYWAILGFLRAVSGFTAASAVAVTEGPNCGAAAFFVAQTGTFVVARLVVDVFCRCHCRIPAVALLSVWFGLGFRFLLSFVLQVIDATVDVIVVVVVVVLIIIDRVACWPLSLLCPYERLDLLPGAGA